MGALLQHISAEPDRPLALLLRLWDGKHGAKVGVQRVRELVRDSFPECDVVDQPLIDGEGWDDGLTNYVHQELFTLEVEGEFPSYVHAIVVYGNPSEDDLHPAEDSRDVQYDTVQWYAIDDMDRTSPRLRKTSADNN